MKELSRDVISTQVSIDLMHSIRALLHKWIIEETSFLLTSVNTLHTGCMHRGPFQVMWLLSAEHSQQLGSSAYAVHIFF